MIVKGRTLPIRIQQEEVLLSRLNKNHKKYSIILDDHKRRITGYQGEQSIDYYLSLLPDEDLFIFHDVRLITNSFPFQIDTLILTSQFALILEVKNISGTLYFDTKFRQLIQIIEEKKKGLPYPITQIKRQQEHLQKWLEEKNIKSFPILGLVVISKPSTILDTNSEGHHIFDTVVRAENLIDKMIVMKDLYKKKFLNVKQIQSLSSKIIKENTPLFTDILQAYQLDTKDIIRGVQCPECDMFPMKYHRGYWHCSNCKSRSKSASKRAILDYLLLFNQTISNQQCRSFLLLNSPKISLKILKSMDLIPSGKGKLLVYRRPSIMKRN